MKKIFKVFLSDARRLSTNVVAVVVIIGLSVIPCLYAWFNILSNWDPYGEEATSNLSVAVASSDTGKNIEGAELNVGNIIISNLKENKTINWVFPDSPEEAIDGVYSGDYYAALIMEEDFTANMISFLGGDTKHPVIVYYENEKKNAIAPKITNKVKNTVQQEVNTAFVSTMAEVLIEASEYVVDTDGSGNLTNVALEKMYTLDGDITTCLMILDSYISVVDSTEALMKASEAVTDQMDIIMTTGDDMMNATDAAADAAQQSVNTVSDVVDQTFVSLEGSLTNMETMVDATMSALTTSAEKIATTTAYLQQILVLSQSVFDSTMSANGISTNTTSVTLSDGTTTTCSALVSNVDSDFARISTDLANISSISTTSAEDANAIWKVLKADINACQRDVAALKSAYTNTVKPQLNTTMSSLQNSLNEVKGLLNYSTSSISGVSAILGAYPNMMGASKEEMVASRKQVASMQEKLRDLIADMEGVETNEQYAILVKLLKSDPKLIAEFISEPVDLEEYAYYEMENNGSATAPFYIILSIWVGSLIIATLIKTKVKDTPELKDVSEWQRFFGRYIVFFLIGQLQTIITVLGSLFYVNIQCVHPFYFWLACSASSLTFSFFMYAMTYAWGSVGEGAAVVLMVIQVAGSGGTFPVEVLPIEFQMVYKYMPFMYGMNAVRESVAGMYQHDYWFYMLGNVYYIAGGLVIGLLLAKPYAKLKDKIEDGLHASGCM